MEASRTAGGAPASPEAAALTLELTGLLRGGSGTHSTVVAILNRELRAIAQGLLRSGRPDAQATELVNAVYLKLFDRAQLGVHDRKHFYTLAARAMRQILVDQYRRGRREDADGGLCTITLSRGGGLDEVLDLIDLDAALAELAERDARQAQVVELRYFGDLEVAEVADVLEVSVSTVERDWRVARAWLRSRLGRAGT